MAEGNGIGIGKLVFCVATRVMPVLQEQKRYTYLEILIGESAPSRSSLLADVTDALGDIGGIVILHGQDFSECMASWQPGEKAGYRGERKQQTRVKEGIVPSNRLTDSVSCTLVILRIL